MKTACFTICSRNYLAYALTLQKSVQAAMPGSEFFIYLADEPVEPGRVVPATVIPVAELGLPDLKSMAFRYTVMEFNTAIKADCFLDLLTRRGFEAAVYLDPDIQVFRPMGEVFEALQDGASAVLTPHILSPLPAGASPSEDDILKSGVFNLGFAAFARTEESLAFLRWWAGKLHTDCYSAPERGLFVDQRFVDLAPAFIQRLSVLRHPGYNVAYWNLAQRRLEERPDGVSVNGQPLVFFHFSGIEPGDANVFSKHQGRPGAGVSAVVIRLMHAYQAELAAQGHADWSCVPYSWSQFRDGSPILPPMRRRPPEMGTPAEWFAAPELDYWNEPDPRVQPEEGQRITRLMMGFWELRPDVQAAFPLGTSAGRIGLNRWYFRHAQREYNVPRVFTLALGDARRPMSAPFKSRISSICLKTIMKRGSR